MHDGIALVGLVPIRHEVVGLLPIASVYLLLVHEAHHVDYVLGLELEVINFLWVDEDVLTFGVLVAFDDFLICHFGKAVTVVNAFHVPNRCT